MINLSVLPQAMNLRSLHTRILKTLTYPLPTTCFTNDDCVALEAALYRKSLPKCGVSSKLPLAVRYAPVGYMGIGMPQLHVQQGICHLRELIRALPTNGITSQQMQISNEVLHLMTGTPTWIFDQHHSQLAKLIDEVWMQSTWEFVLTYHITVFSPKPYFTLPRQHDSFLMPTFIAMDIPTGDLTKINQCRLYLQVLTISDIVDAGGHMVLTDYMNGHRPFDRQSQYNWPEQGRPDELSWRLWRHHLRKAYLLPRSTVMRLPLGEWRYKSHQKWIWRHDIHWDCLYRATGRVYARYDKVHDLHRNTRSNQCWYMFHSIVQQYDKTHTRICTVSRTTNTQALWTSTSYATAHHLPSMTKPPNEPQPLLDTYYTFRQFSDNDDGATLAQRMSTTTSNLVGDGSYERKDDSGSAAFILETSDKSSRISNAHLVPANTPTIFEKHNDPYRCELFALFSGLLTIYDLEKRFSTIFQPITIAVDNDSALEHGTIFIDDILATNQHFDILQAIRTLRTLIRSLLIPTIVQDHRDREVHQSELTTLESLNYECDLIAKFARVHMQMCPGATPSLRLPFESIAIWLDDKKIYKNFNSELLNFCSMPQIRAYYMKKYQWDQTAFQAINWEAINSAMKLVSFSTRTWLSKFNCGFIGTAAMLSYREYWLHDSCPLCSLTKETNQHILQCPHPPHRQKLLMLLNDLKIWLSTSNCEPILASEIIRITTLWMNPQNHHITSNCPPIQHQIQIGWHHLLFGKISKRITEWQHNYVIAHSLRRDAQSWTSRFIQKIWTKLLRPAWQHRNSVVHSHEKRTTTTRLYQDIQEEVSELYRSTDVEMLAAIDKPLFDQPLDTLLQQPQQQLQAWCNSVETAMKYSLQPSSTTHDPTQLHLPFAPPPIRLQQPPVQEPLPTAVNSPHLTPIQRRIK